MNYKSFIAGAMAFALAACTAGCGDKKDSDTKTETENTTAAPVEETTPEDTTAEDTTEPEPPKPVEATDSNAVTFDNGLFDFAYVKSEDPDCAVGTLSVEEVMGNKMLKFTDDNTVPLKGKVQKVRINAVKLLGSEGIAKVRRIEFDLYAQATADHLKTNDAEGVRAPGWIGGGGGTVTANSDRWYDFQEFEGGEYNFETSGAVHVKFKFLLADSGQCWSEDMEDANFLIMRWGIANEADLMIDNIVFYDEDGNSIPLTAEYSGNASASDGGAEAADTEVASGEVELTDDLKKQFEDAEKLADEVNAQAQEAIEEASRQVAEKQKK